MLALLFFCSAYFLYNGTKNTKIHIAYYLQIPELCIYRAEFFMLKYSLSPLFLMVAVPFHQIPRLETNLFKVLFNALSLTQLLEWLYFK